MTIQIVFGLGLYATAHRLQERAEVDRNVDRSSLYLDVPVGPLPVELESITGPLSIDPQFAFELPGNAFYSRTPVVEAKGVRASDVDVSHGEDANREEMTDQQGVRRTEDSVLPSLGDSPSQHLP